MNRVTSVIATLFVVLFVAAFVAMGWVRSAQRHPAEGYPSQIEALANQNRQRNPAEIQLGRGRTVYEHYCAICHGAEGRGDGFNATTLGISPRDLTDTDFWNNSTDERLWFAITRGGSSVGKSELMPAWGMTLAENQTRDVIAFIRSIPGNVEAEVEEPVAETE